MAFWDELSADDRAAIEEIGRRGTYPAGAAVFVEGDEPHQVLIILQGRLKLTRAALDGRQVLIELRGPGELVGELGAVDAAPRSATATVTEPLSAVVLSTPRFRRLLAERGTIALAVLTTVAERLRQSAQRRLESGTTDVLTQLCCRLTELAAGGVRDGNGAVEIASPLTQQELAEWMGVSRDAVVLALRELRDLGWVETGRRRLRLLDVDAISRTAAP